MNRRDALLALLGLPLGAVAARPLTQREKNFRLATRPGALLARCRGNQFGKSQVSHDGAIWFRQMERWRQMSPDQVRADILQRCPQLRSL